MSMHSSIDLRRMPSLRELFQHFNAGKHLNRIAQQGLWVELEREQAQYEALFDALGYTLRIDGRGFAWFHFDQAASNVSKTTQQLALLFLLIFEYQADRGIHLARFTEWPIDQGFLLALIEKHHPLLKAENLAELEQLTQLMRTAANYGFVIDDGSVWRLLPAVFRYLDRFEELARRDTTDASDACEDEWDEGEDTVTEEDDV